jgi:hypothetical protein
VADFERIGRHALKRPEWKGRLKLFEIYFLGGVEYRRAISLVGVVEGTFDCWLQEVKKAAGRQYSRTGLYPPSHFFQSTHANLSASRRRDIDCVRRTPSSNVAAYQKSNLDFVRAFEFEQRHSRRRSL